MVKADPGWRAIDFISDLHLQASERATFDAWRSYMAQTPADALFILGDLFEVWVGDDITAAPDDADSAFALQCQQIIKATSARLPVYVMHGNRDFLLGADFAKACGMTLLPDPTVLDFDGKRWLLSHGDELCLGDIDYQQFRQQVRSEAWRQTFLAKPLPERQAIAKQLRTQSDARKNSGASYADADTAMALSWLEAAQASTLIHGHTHKPGEHVLGEPTGRTLRRLVLSDWDANATPLRLEVLRLQAGTTPKRFPLLV
jgi:UDP-2,3-diacylglucosamine hydrolase